MKAAKTAASNNAKRVPPKTTANNAANKGKSKQQTTTKPLQLFTKDLSSRSAAQREQKGKRADTFNKNRQGMQKQAPQQQPVKSQSKQKPQNNPNKQRQKAPEIKPDDLVIKFVNKNAGKVQQPAASAPVYMGMDTYNPRPQHQPVTYSPYQQPYVQPYVQPAAVAQDQNRAYVSHTSNILGHSGMSLSERIASMHQQRMQVQNIQQPQAMPAYHNVPKQPSASYSGSLRQPWN